MATIKKLESKLKKGVKLDVNLPFETCYYNDLTHLEENHEKCEDISDRLDADESRLDENFNISIVLTKPRITRLYINLNFNTTDISCGVYQMYSLPCNYNINRLSKFINTAEDPEKFFKEILKSILDNVKHHERLAMIIASNNNFTDVSIINNILDDISISKSKWIVNPNSSNKIITWIL